MKDRRTIGRIVIRACIFLLLGAIVNIAVAWGLVYTSSPMFSDGVVSPPADVRIITADDQKSGVYSFWRLSRCDRIGATRYTSFWAGPDARYGLGTEARPPESFLFRWAAHVAPWSTDRTSDVFYRGADARGWPMLSMYSWWHGAVTQRGSGRAVSISFSIAEIHLGCRMMDFGRSSSMDVYRAKIVPIGIVPAGFAINTLFYAAILWLLFPLLRLPFVLRRWQRIKRGLCPACAYPVGTSDLCTECGKPIPASLREKVRCAGSDSAPNDVPGSTLP